MAQIQRFFCAGPLTEGGSTLLDEGTAKHIWQVLRMQEGDRLSLTDGKGNVAEGVLTTAERHKCEVAIQKLHFQPRGGNILHLCVAFTKNNSRNEWLLEKATELGVAEIIPIETQRSEKAHFRHDRWEKILMSGILQSQQSYLPELANIAPLPAVLKRLAGMQQKFIAHCLPAAKQPLTEMLNAGAETTILIGPEGDFTEDEVNLCVSYGFKPVSLGNQRLRTETAAITASAYFNLINDGQI